MSSIRLAVPLSVLAILLSARAQEVLRGPENSGPPALLAGDLAVLEAGDPRKDLNCKVTAYKTILGLDLKFHTGYYVTLPVQELEGADNLLTIVFRVLPKGAESEPVYFSQKFRVPQITEKSGDLSLSGTFDVGEGSYHVDWLMRDLDGRLCSSYWGLEVALAPKDKQIMVALPAQTVRPSEDEQFQPEPPVPRGQPEPPLHVKILMNFGPERLESAALDPQDRLALVSILRNLSRNPLIGRISLVAFNLQERKILYQQNASDQIDFPSMGKALNQLRLGTVDITQLEHKNGEMEFLTGLIKSQTCAGDKADGLIFLGPKSLIDSSVPQEDLKEIGELEYPVFYMNYARDPEAIPWRDAIGRVVKFFKGREYTISGPRELGNALTEVVSRIAKTKQARSAGTPAAPKP